MEHPDILPRVISIKHITQFLLGWRIFNINQIEETVDDF